MPAISGGRRGARVNRFGVGRTLAVFRNLLAALGLLMVIVNVTPLTFWWATVLSGDWKEPRGEVLVVLGGSVLDNGKIGGSSYWRAIYGAMVYKQGGFRDVLICGGREGTASISYPMRELMVTLGVPADHVRIEDQSTSTRENARFSAELLRDMPGRKVLLTSDYHMYRALRVFRQSGITIEPWPFPDVRKRYGAWINRWSCFQDVALETVKIAFYYARGWI